MRNDASDGTSFAPHKPVFFAAHLLILVTEDIVTD